MENLYKPEGELVSQIKNREYLSSVSGLERAMQSGRILEGIAVKCDSEMNLFVELDGIIGKIPRGEVQYSRNDEEIKDIAVITRVGRAVCFKVIGFCSHNGKSCVLLSRREAQKECLHNYLDRIVPGDIIPAKVTHLERFGAFVDIGCGIISLLPVDSISVSRIAHPNERLGCGECIYTVVKQIERDKGRFFVSQRELFGTWEENAAAFSSGQTVSGIVRSIESYGIFVELSPNLAGLAELKDGVEIGDAAAVYIKSIIPERMKVKLVLVDTAARIPQKIRTGYFIDPTATTHIDAWRYSPSVCPRVIESRF